MDLPAIHKSYFEWLMILLIATILIYNDLRVWPLRQYNIVTFYGTYTKKLAARNLILTISWNYYIIWNKTDIRLMICKKFFIYTHTSILKVSMFSTRWPSLLIYQLHFKVAFWYPVPNKALSHLAGSALRTSLYTQIFYPVAKSPVRQKMYASQKCICNEHRLTRTHLMDRKRT